MTEKEAQEFKRYSKIVVPPGWEPLLIKNETGLVWLGSDNLRLMLEAWTVTQHACETLLKVWTKYEEKTGKPNPRASYHSKMVKRAQAAIPIVQKALKEAVSKPIFPKHRPFGDSFNVGDKVLVYVPALEYESFIPGIVMEVTDNDCFIAASEEYDFRKVSIPNRSPLVLKIEDVKYLSMNPSYLGMFTCLAGFTTREDYSTYADMILDARKAYFPETLDLNTENAPNGLFVDNNSDTSD